MQTAEIRQRWLDYFAAKGHHIVPSASLISPDPTLLFTVAGMVPFIPYIVGTEQAPWPRVASVQKCIRTNDIDNVGRTTRHGTFFQMNGNFSFGDYFKEGAIHFAWELLTSPQDQGGYGFDGDRFWVTLWDQDTESFDVLTRDIGMDPKHIVRLPREENFWDTGQPGPAGPCAEFHYDRGPQYGPDAAGGNVDPGGDRYLEIWNLVFDQYMRGPGTGKNYPLLHELQQKAIDTGAGLERIAFLLQGKDNMYEIDQVYPVIAATEEITGRTYHSAQEDDVRMRLIADHVRSALMLIGDGVRPANEGRGYVLRRLVRRVVRSLRLMGVHEAALPHLLPVSRDAMSPSYPNLATDFDRISSIAYGEEETFLRTLTAGTVILDAALARAISSSETASASAGGNTSGATTTGAPTSTSAPHPTLSGDEAFTLHDTYGFPIDLTLEIAHEQGVDVDEKAFRELMAQQKARARADAVAKKTGHTDASVYESVKENLHKPVEFTGYTDLQGPVRVAGILVDGQPVPTVTAPAQVEVIVDRTPFYAQAGGQLADQGTIHTDEGATIEVADVQEPVKGVRVHRGTLTEGTLSLDDTGVAQVDPTRRRAIARAHTGTHLLHKALQETLGKGATQAGSEDAPNHIRFDFHAGQAPSADAMAEIEARVNDRLRDNLAVSWSVMDLDDARAKGAMALFGEKYGRQVRVVDIGDAWSLELCAGTHVDNTGELGMVTLLGESSVGSGLRRVEAVVAGGADDQRAKERALVSQLTGLLQTRPEEIPDRVESLMAKLKDTEKQLAQMRQSQLLSQAGQVAQGAQTTGKVRYASWDAGQVGSSDDVRALALDVRTKMGEEPAVVAVAGQHAGRAVLVVATNAAARDAGANAGALAKEATAQMGGKGGGKPDVAQGGGTEPERIGAALSRIAAVLGGQ